MTTCPECGNHGEEPSCGAIECPNAWQANVVIAVTDWQKAREALRERVESRLNWLREKSRQYDKTDQMYEELVQTMNLIEELHGNINLH